MSGLESFNPVTPQGLSIANLFLTAMVLSAFIFLLVVGLMVYVLLRYRGRPGDEEPPQVHGNRNLEIAWTVTPALILAALFVMTLRTMSAVQPTAEPELRIKVVGHQWWWEFQYPDRGVITANEMRVPVGANVLLEIEAADVIHSFWVPKLGWKKDAIPGRTNLMWARFEQEGAYEGPCAEYCGIQHAWMRILVVAEAPEKFEAWIQQQSRPAPDRPVGDKALRGQEIFLANTCVNCHAIRGTRAAARIGPDLTHFGSRQTIGAGVAANTPENLRRWIREVQSVKPGALMPNYTDLSEDDLAALAEFVGGLK